MLELVEQSSYITISAGVCAAMILLVIVVHFLTRHVRFMKYLPGIAAVVIGATALTASLDDFLVASEIDRVVLYGILLGAGLIGILSAWILGILDKEVKPRKKSLSRKQPKKSMAPKKKPAD